MSFKHKRRVTATALFAIVAVMQTYVGVSFAARESTVIATTIAAQELSGILTTQDNKPINVNGASSATGATILNGAMIETPDQVKATISIPGHGTVEIAPNTKFTLTFDQNGIKINLIQGCLVLLTKKGTSGEVDNAQGVVGKTDSANDGKIDVCPTKVAGIATAGGGGLFGLGTAATIAIVAGGAGAVAAIALGNRGSNPSPATP